MEIKNKGPLHRFQMSCLLKITLHRVYLEILLIIWSAPLALDFFWPIQSVPVFVCVKPRIRETDFAFGCVLIFHV